jgi:HCOMODA/2-hydroxy-3-carboxy-muconic semialdehyde decarboxylase
MVVAYKVLVNEGVLDGFGHISIRSSVDPTRFIIPRAMPPSLVEASDVLEVSVETSQPIDPKGRRTNGERYLHGEIYKARPDVMAVVHSHSPAVIPLTLIGAKLRPVMVQAAFMPLVVPDFELRDVRGEGGRGLQITDIPRGLALAKCLGAGTVATLRGHGVVVAASNVRDAAVFSIYTEINAKMQLQAMAINPDFISLDEPELFGKGEFDTARPWEHYRQKLLSDGARSQIDRSQFGLAHTQ